MAVFVYFAYTLLLANSADPDQMPHSVMSELGLQCLHNTPKRGS